MILNYNVHFEHSLNISTVFTKKRTPNFKVNFTLFSDGQVRVRGVATDEYNRKLVRNRLQSGESVSSFDQPSGEVKTLSNLYSLRR